VGEEQRPRARTRRRERGLGSGVTAADDDDVELVERSWHGSEDDGALQSVSVYRRSFPYPPAAHTRRRRCPME